MPGVLTCQSPLNLKDIITAIETVNHYTQRKGVWVMDRGGDRDKLLFPLITGSPTSASTPWLMGSRRIRSAKRGAFTAVFPLAIRKPASDGSSYLNFWGNSSKFSNLDIDHQAVI